MKQKISSGAFIAIVAAVVVIAAGVSVWIWRSPSVASAPPLTKAELNTAMKEAHSGPTPEQLKQIQEWKKAHPGAYSKY